MMEIWLGKGQFFLTRVIFKNEGDLILLVGVRFLKTDTSHLQDATISFF